MTSYNTGNPVPSTAIKDLYDNAQNLDDAVNGDMPRWTDRMGRSRASISGVQASFDEAIGSASTQAAVLLASLGYLVPVAYTADLLVDSARFTVTYNGDTYAAVATAVPFVTTAEFDASKWRLMQGVTAADLASSNGAAMVGYSVYGQDTAAYRLLSDVGFTPKMFLAAGDGVTDDFTAIQRMFSLLPYKGRASFDPAKEHYNDFTAVSDYQDRREWLINQACTIDFQGARLTRKTPVYNGVKLQPYRVDTQTEYTEDCTAVVRITGDGPFNLYNLNVDGNNPSGQYPYGIGTTPVQNTDLPQEMTICQVQDIGIFGFKANNINIINAKVQKCAFNMWFDQCEHVYVQGRSDRSGQVLNKITATDNAYGSGCKFFTCEDVTVDLVGEWNANSLLEIERENSNVRAKIMARKNFAYGMTIINSRMVTFEANVDKLYQQCAVHISHYDGDIATGSIHGKIVAYDCYNGSLELRNRPDATADLIGVHLNIIGEGSTFYGIRLLNDNSNGKIIDNVSIRYSGYNNCPSGTHDIRIQGDVRARLSGRIAAAGGVGSTTGVGIRIADDVKYLFLDVMDLSQNAFAWYIPPSLIGTSHGPIFDAAFVKTPTFVAINTTADNVRIAKNTIDGQFQKLNSISLEATRLNLSNTPSAADSLLSGDVWVDTANGNVLKRKA